MADRKAELERKRKRLEEMKKAREEKKKVFDKKRYDEGYNQWKPKVVTRLFRIIR